MSYSAEEVRENQAGLAAFKAKKFALVLFMIASFMIFAALSSGYIVYTAGGIDKGIKILLPQAFITSTVAIVLSSITMHLAFIATKNKNANSRKIYLLISIVLGIVFFFSQYRAWQVLVEQGAYFINNNA